MTTSDWAIVISLLAAGISLISLGWNVWSKFIYPKAKVRVNFRLMAVAGTNEEFLLLTATNHGPGTVTLTHTIAHSKKPWLKNRQSYILKPLIEQQITTSQKREFALFRSRKVAVGDECTVYFNPDQLDDTSLAIVDIGFADSFDREHFAPRKKVRDVFRRLSNSKELTPEALTNTPE